MALIQCIQCNNKISDKVQRCPHCDLELTSVSNEQVERLHSQKRYEKQQRLTIQSFIAMLLFIGGFWWLYYGSNNPDSWQTWISQAAIAIGFFWYLIIRVQLILLKRH